MKRYAKFVEGAQQRIVNRTDELMRSKFQQKTDAIDFEEQRAIKEA